MIGGDDPMARNSSRINDPARLLALLWNSAEPTGRTGLSVAGIATAAVELADADGLDAVTMRRIADRLGAGTMSLYSYVPGKPELIELMNDQVAGEIYAAGGLPAAEGDWRAGVRRIAERNWEHQLRHRWLAETAPGRPVLGPGTTAKYEAELAPLDGIGLSDVEMDLVLGHLLGLVEATARWQIQLDRARRESGIGDAGWWARVGPLLEQAMAGREFPLADRVGSAAGEHYQAAGAPLEQMTFGVDLLVEGITAYLG
jgi:AcrR family transcriptional regulator